MVQGGASSMLTWSPCQALAPPEYERAQPLVAQADAAPQERAENDREGDWKQPIAGAQVRCDRATQIARQQDGSEDGGTRDQIEYRTGEQHDPKTENDAFRVSEFHR